MLLTYGKSLLNAVSYDAVEGIGGRIAKEAGMRYYFTKAETSTSIVQNTGPQTLPLLSKSRGEVVESIPLPSALGVEDAATHVTQVLTQAIGCFGT